MSRPKINVKEKCQKELPDFVAEVDALSSEALNSRLSQGAKDYAAVEEAIEADEELQAAKENVSLRSAPYSDAKKVLRLKSRYIIALLKDKGQS